MKTTKWQKLEMTTGLFLKRRPSMEDQLLMGLRLGGIAKDMVIQPGGKISVEDLGPFTACCRETKAEAGLQPLGGTRVAELRITIARQFLKIRVHVFLFTDWKGQLRNRTPEFAWLKFVNLSKIDWNLTPPQDEKWLKRVLVNHGNYLVHINCGTSRKDVRSFRIRTLK